MRKEGLEPSPQRDMILSHARLPIPPLPHGEDHARIIVRETGGKTLQGAKLLQLDAGDIGDINAADLVQ